VNVCDADAFLDARTNGTGAAEDYLVEYCAANGQARVAETVKTVVSGELTIRNKAVGSAHAHAG